MSPNRQVSRSLVMLVPLFALTLLRIGPLASIPIASFASFGALGETGDGSESPALGVCPVCGLAVDPESRSVAEIVLADGSVVYFDRTSDMFRYLLGRRNFGKNWLSPEIEGVFVTSFFDGTRFPARGAHFVLCDEAASPRLIAHRTRMELEAFLRHHRGEKVLRFAQILEGGLPDVL